ncbi:MAG: hypothetical protein H6737_00195 [Alphaproteobacteria bacterium]|nr:hypothetical protein [Alphaproteobacteria bacterium]
MLTLLALALPALGAMRCGDLDSLELEAARSRLDAGTEACLEEALGAAEAAERARTSFVLILSAYSGNDLEAYGERMRRHLATFHTTDAEVAYLYARYLWKKSGETADPPYTDEILKWSRVAMDGRTRWLHNRRNYDEMVRNLYDMLVQSSLRRALLDKKAFEADPSDANRLVADQAQRRARHYLIVAAPCLHKGECGPTFEVIVEGMRECEDLAPLENYAAAGKLDEGHRACLRARFRRQGAPRRRILDLLIADAEKQPDSSTFEYLLAWHWNVTDADDPEMAYRFARWLARNDGDPKLLAQWAEAGLEAGRPDEARRSDLIVWRAEGWAAVVRAAEAEDAKQSTERTRRELANARTRSEAATQAQREWCTTHPCSRP